MRRKSLTMTAVLLLLMSVPTWAVPIDSFVNLDFDSGAVTTGGPGFKGFDAPEATEIIGWSNYRNGAAGPLNDAGVEAPSAWWVKDNTPYMNAAFMSSNDAAYNTSSYVIQTGDVFTIKYIAGVWGWTGTGQWTATLFYDTPTNVIDTYVQGISNDFQGEDVWFSSPEITATPASVGHTLGILFKSSGTGIVQIDEITVDRILLKNNSPANGATLIPVEKAASGNDLVFTVNSSDVKEVDVQFGTENDPNLTIKSAYKIVDGMSVTAGQYTVDLESLANDLENNKTYYWKVIGYEPNAVSGLNDIAVPGPVWSFTTIPLSPVFTVNPTDTSAFEAGTVVLTATCSSIEPIGAIQWWKVGSPDVQITTGAGVSIAEEVISSELTKSTLTISNATAAREGLYYDQSTNTAGSGISTNARVTIKRLLAQYQFENTTNDSSASGLHGTVLTPSGAAATMAYVDSMTPAMGKAISFTGTGTSDPANTTDPYVDLPNGFDNFTQGITISAWVYPTATANWGRIVEFGNGTNGDNNSFYFTRVGSDTTLRFENDNANPNSRTSVTTGANGIVNNVWQHLVIAIDTNATNNAVIYRNGVAVGTGTVTLPNVVTRTNCYIGRSEWNGDSLYQGSMDNVAIYNYALSATEVAEQYTAATPEADYICMSALTYDLNADCRVDLDDIAALAQNWLGCDRLPASACSW